MIKQKRILILVGTRPNFIKVTQFKKVAIQYPQLDIKIVHTSQHYSDEMSKIFFEELNLHPDFFLNIPTNLSVISQMAEIMKSLETLIQTQFYPDLIMVVGDVNSTLAGALVANKMNIPLAHLESGLRSFDYTMPEEYNRVLTDKMSQYLFVTELDAINNLKYEFIKQDNVFFVGNTMIDTLLAYQDKIDASPILSKLQIEANRYCLLTMHRPANVDSQDGLNKMIDLIVMMQDTLSQRISHIVFPMHPRTEQNIKKYHLWEKITSIPSLIITKPLSYLNFQKLIKHAYAVITDSGGVQEETSYLHIPCLTLRPDTERPVTLWQGTNIILPYDAKMISEYLHNLSSSNSKKNSTIPLWDGKATERVLAILSKILS